MSLVNLGDTLDNKLGPILYCDNEADSGALRGPYGHIEGHLCASLDMLLNLRCTVDFYGAVNKGCEL